MISQVASKEVQRAKRTLYGDLIATKMMLAFDILTFTGLAAARALNMPPWALLCEMLLDFLG